VLLAQDLALVLDYLNSADTHTYTQAWHLAPGETFTQNGLDIVATNAKGVQNLALHQAITSGIQLASFTGQESPIIQGWYSADYGTRVANYALEYSTTASAQGFGTLIASGPYVTKPVTVKVTFAAGPTIAVTATVCAGSTALDVAIQNLAASAESITVVPSTQCP
jgi:hypothetical protein